MVVVPKIERGFILLVVLIFISVIGFTGMSLMKDSILEFRLANAYHHLSVGDLGAESGLECFFKKLSLQYLGSPSFIGLQHQFSDLPLSTTSLPQSLFDVWGGFSFGSKAGCDIGEGDAFGQPVELHQFAEVRAVTQTRFCGFSLASEGSDVGKYQASQYVSTSFSKLPEPIKSRSVREQAWEVVMPVNVQALPVVVVADKQGNIHERSAKNNCE